MNRKFILKSVFFVATFAIIAFLQMVLLKGVKVTSDVITNIITFLSILFGFYITSLAIFVTSRYVSDLYKITDLNNPTTTLLHTLVRRYKYGLNFILFSIAYLLVLGLCYSKDPTDVMSLSDKRLILFGGVVILNFVYSYWMLANLIKIIIQEAKSHKSPT